MVFIFIIPSLSYILLSGEYIFVFQITVADIAMLSACEFLHMGCPDLDLAAKYPTWNSIVCCVKQDEKIAKWIETRPKTDF